MNNLAKDYLIFLAKIEIFYSQSSFPRMDSLEIKVLNQIATDFFSKNVSNVVNTMQSIEGMSLASVHRKLKTLVIKGYIVLEVDNFDTRFKNIKLTPLALKYFDGLGRCL